MTPERAYAELREANPAPVVQVADRPKADDALANAISADKRTVESSHIRSSLRIEPATRLHGAWIAAVVFVIVLLAGFVTTLLLSGSGEVVDDPVVPTTLLQTPTTIESSASTPTTISAEVLGLVENFSNVYNSGDHDALLSLLHPDTTFMFDRQSDPPAPWSSDDLRIRHQIATELSTTVTLTSCEQLSGIRISCQVVLVDDLVRIAGIDPPADTFWRFAFEDGLAIQWEELRPDTPRYNEARAPFIRWLTETHPEIENPAVFIGAPWRTDTGIEDQIAELVDQYAASLGVRLDE